ncbi:MAG: hypothetical protein MMC33_009830 [Icmadophila ericetorum]|nr:hypothetical protein [Icmadophila ericetorum]
MDAASRSTLPSLELLSVVAMNPQSSSPLFRLLPGEIRNQIFSLALTPYPDLSRPYHQGTHYYRPGHHYPIIAPTALLLTCRRICCETAHLPLALNEIAYWCGRGPPEHVHQNRQESLPPAYWDFIPAPSHLFQPKVHFFTQQAWLAEEFPRWAAHPSFNPAIIHITLRHTDWWGWDSGNSMLMLDPFTRGIVRVQQAAGTTTSFPEHGSLADALGKIRGLRKLILELEAVTAKVLQLDGVVRKAQEWEFQLHGGGKLVFDENQPKRPSDKPESAGFGVIQPPGAPDAEGVEGKRTRSLNELHFTTWKGFDRFFLAFGGAYATPPLPSEQQPRNVPFQTIRSSSSSSLSRPDSSNQENVDPDDSSKPAWRARARQANRLTTTSLSRARLRMRQENLLEYIVVKLEWKRVEDSLPAWGNQK